MECQMPNWRRSYELLRATPTQAVEKKEESAKYLGRRALTSVMRKAQIESQRQTVARQLMSGRQDRKTYHLRKRWVWQENKWVSTKKPQVGPRGQRQADQRKGQWALPPNISLPRPAVNKHAPLPARHNKLQA